MQRVVHLSISAPRLTLLAWLDPPATVITAGERFPTFSVAADDDVTDRVRLEEQSRTPATTADSMTCILGERHATIRSVAVKDLEPIQDRSLVDFSHYIIQSRT